MKVSAPIREFSPEADLLLRRRLMAFKRRANWASNDAVATELNGWEEITRWFPKAFSKKSPVFSDSILYRWISGDVSHGHRIHTPPKDARRTVIAEFLIQKRYLFEFELVPDEQGYGFAAALGDFLHSAAPTEDYAAEGEYEAITDDDNSLMLHRVTINRDKTTGILLFEARTARSYSRSQDSEAKLRARLDSEYSFKTAHKGWGVISEAKHCLAFMRPVSDPIAKPEPWLWKYEPDIHARMISTVWTGTTAPSAESSPRPEMGHAYPVMKSLTSGNDMSYHFSRKGGFDLAIIRSIMEINSKGTLPEIDREFLRAAYRCDPDLAKAALDKGANVNAVDPETGLTALLYAASGGVGGMVEFLAKEPDLNPTIKDRHGRLPSDLVPLVEDLQPVAYRLIEMEEDYYRINGISPWQP